MRNNQIYNLDKELRTLEKTVQKYVKTLKLDDLEKIIEKDITKFY